MICIDGTPARLPRVKLLPGCLALALAVGLNGLSPACAKAQVPLTSESSIPAGDAAGWSTATLIAQVQSLARTPAMPATAIVVSNCNDNGPGSLRQAVADSVSGGTIDLTQTGCSTITLTTGGITTSTGDLTLQGPGMLALAIDGGNHYRPLQHNGSGTLRINDLEILNGRKYVANGQPGNPAGACIQSAGTVVVDHAWITRCSASSSSTTSGVRGGAIYAKTGVTLISSIVSENSATSTGSFAYGGGVYTQGSLAVIDSSISGNTAHSTVGFAQGGGAQVGSVGSGHTPGGVTLASYSTIHYNTAISDANNASSIGGGLYTTGNVTIKNTTISGNQARFAGGLELVRGANVSGPWTLVNDTISDNTATSAVGGASQVGGIRIGTNATQIQNSTIAFNSVHSTSPNTYGAGVQVNGAVAVDLESTIIASNASYEGSFPHPDDINGSPGASLTGANNLIVWPALLTPPGTILRTDPRLAPLSSNGGLGWTHALSPHSPAINAGNNLTGAQFDQRGTGHPRVIGAAPDIGAFEFDLNDLIFANGFD
ncbi:choice-of-anchor Q domain-containing protein [Dokdonella soli]|uniref:CSLREA domain-containing protein n=1 Tax=Dokdonella soli TaxID=529810 RepID=A0ABN1ISW7_9GAMM